MNAPRPAQPDSLALPEPFTQHCGLDTLQIVSVKALTRRIPGRKARRSIADDVLTEAADAGRPVVPMLSDFRTALERRLSTAAEGRAREKMIAARRALFNPAVIDPVNCFGSQRARFMDEVNIALRQFGNRQWRLHFGHNPLQPRSFGELLAHGALRVQTVWREWFNSPQWVDLDVAYDGTSVAFTFRINEHDKFTSFATPL